MMEKGPQYHPVLFNNAFPPMTAMLIASYCGHNHIVEYFVDRRGYPVDRYPVKKCEEEEEEEEEEKRFGSSYTPVEACFNGHYDVITTLLSRGAYPGIVVVHELTALMVASDDGYDDIVRVLLHYPSVIATIDCEDYHHYHTALHKAVSKGHVGVFKLLLEGGANSVMDDFMIAQDKGYKEIVRLLTVRVYVGRRRDL